MIDSIKQFLKDEGYHDSIALSTLLDALYDAGNLELAQRVEVAMEEMKMSAVTRVSTFLSKFNN